MKKKGTCRVLAFGTFDILHPGHISYLNQCKRFGDELTVVIARDETVLKLKGRKTVFDEQSRRMIISSLKCVNRAILGSRTNHYDVIKKARPNVVCLGYDHVITVGHFEAQLDTMGIKQPRIIRMKKWRASTFKSSLIKEQLCAPQ